MEQIRVSSYQLVVTVICLVCLRFSVGMSSESDPLIKTYVSSSLPSKDGFVSYVKPLTESEWDSLVLQSKLPVMVTFITDTCIPCILMVPTLDRLDSDYKDQFKFYTVYIEKEPLLKSRYNILVTPTTIFFKNGHKMLEYTGTNPSDLEYLVKQLK